MRRKKRESGVERVHPPDTYCRNCVRDCGGQPYREMDHEGTMVPICVKCSDEPVRERDHLFSSSSYGVGDGNRRTRAR